jgi:putative transposase
MSKKDDSGSRKPDLLHKERSAEDKMRLVLEASQLSEDELGAFLRREGLHEAELDQWRDAMMSGLKPAASKRARSNEARRVRELEKELRRKDKALAEAAALLVLQKKVQALWGDEDDDTKKENDEWRSRSSTRPWLPARASRRRARSSASARARSNAGATTKRAPTAAPGLVTRPRTSSPRPRGRRSSRSRTRPSSATRAPSRSSRRSPTAVSTSPARRASIVCCASTELAHRGRARPPTASRPKELVARAPNQIWCWDITYMRAAVRGTFYFLYLVVDVFSRKIVAWTVESEELMVPEILAPA